MMKGEVKELMPLSIAKSHCRRLTLFLAFAACSLQVLSFSLPSLVVCFHDGRPPRVEFFTDSCSCRQEKGHSCGEHDQSGASCLESACLDVHLGSHSILAATVRPYRAHANGSRLMPATDSQASPPDLKGASAGRRGPFAEAPPPRSAPLASFQLRC